MRITKIAVLAMTLSCTGLLSAAEKTPPEKSSDAAAEQTKTGTLGTKPANAAADVVAILYTAGTDYKLHASGASEAKLQDLAKKSAKVQLSGTLNGDVLTVTKVVEVGKSTDDAADKQDKNKDKDKNKSDKKKKKNQN